MKILIARILILPAIIAIAACGIATSPGRCDHGPDAAPDAGITHEPCWPECGPGPVVLPDGGIDAAIIQPDAAPEAGSLARLPDGTEVCIPVAGGRPCTITNAPGQGASESL